MTMDLTSLKLYLINFDIDYRLGLIVERITHYRVIFEDLQPDKQLHESNKLRDEDQPATLIKKI